MPRVQGVSGRKIHTSLVMLYFVVHPYPLWLLTYPSSVGFPPAAHRSVFRAWWGPNMGLASVCIHVRDLVPCSLLRLRQHGHTSWCVVNHSLVHTLKPNAEANVFCVLLILKPGFVVQVHSAESDVLILGLMKPCFFQSISSHFIMLSVLYKQSSITRQRGAVQLYIMSMKCW